jgi:hypothetical protein
VTQNEFDIAQALTIVESMESNLAQISYHTLEEITDAEQNEIRLQLRTWKARLRSSMTIRAARSDKGTPRG